MNFEITRFTVCKNGNTLRATADICFGGQITVKGCKVVERKDGVRFLALPTRKGGDKYYPIVLIENELREKVEQNILARMNQSEDK